MTKQTKKFNWTGFLIILIIIALVGFFGWFLFGRSSKTENFDQFNAQIEKNKGAENFYFESVEYDTTLDNIYAVEHTPQGTTKYTIGGLTPELQKYYFNPAGAGHNDLLLAAQGPDGTQNPVEAIPGSKPSVFLSIVISLLPFLLIVILLVWFLRKSKGSSTSPFGAGKNRAIRIDSKKKFTDVAGNEEVKEEVIEVVDYLKNPTQYKNAGAAIPKGILLEGPPGTGKTLIAKATAGEAHVPFFFVSGSNFVEMFVGVGAARVRDMFKTARRSSPCIIFIDELDAVGRSRGTGLGGGNDEREQTLNQILVELDGMEESTGVIVIAATNRADVLDPALLRPGRFDRVIKVNLPDVKEREAILRIHARGKRIHPEVDFALLARRTPGYSGAQLSNVINEAALLSVRRKNHLIMIEDLDEAVDRVMAGPARKSRVISKEELEMVAYHEAGHAVIGLKVPGGQIVQKVTIIPRGNFGGYNLMTPAKETMNYKKSELMAKIMSFMGGRAAEQIIYGTGEVSTGAADDITKATAIARAMVTQWGMSPLGPIQYERSEGGPFLGRDFMRNKNFSDKVGYEIDREVRAIIDYAEKKAFETIRKFPRLHKAIASALLEKETIVAEEIRYIAKHYKLPPTKKAVKDDLSKPKSLSQILKMIKSKPHSKHTPNSKVVLPNQKKQPKSKKAGKTRKN